MISEEDPQLNRGSILPKVSVDEIDARVLDLASLVSRRLADG